MSQFQPVILLGAARSGTKMLRDLIAEHPQIDCVPYDVNYIWRLGNERCPHDELTTDMAMPVICETIRRQLSRFHQGSPLLIEKTVSNCLRVPFVQQVFPKAKYLYLVRDPRDVIESSARQWLAPTDWKYVFAKLRTFPVLQAFGYGLRYAAGIAGRLIRRNEARRALWGPHYEGMAEDSRQMDLLEVCTRQWMRSVALASAAVQQLPAGQVHHIRYEDFVRSPISHIRKIAAFLDIAPGPIEPHAARVTATNVGKGTLISDDRWQELKALIDAGQPAGKQRKAA